MIACTIVARNYLPAARLLAASFLENHPNSSFVVLLLDATEQDKPGESFEVLTSYEIGLDPREVHRMAMLYDVTEFATAVKPWLLKTLLTRAPGDVAAYFDPDIEIFAPLDDVAELARNHSIVLTPHMMSPLPADGLRPDDLMILKAGIYNLGFIGVGARAGRFLDWWSSKLARDCFVALDLGQFVDQRWVDFVPALFEHVVLRDPTCNVAYWNLHERSIQWTGDRYEVNGGPLRFFHFSGFDPRKPRRFSAHTAPAPRVRLSDHPDLARLCGEYGERLVQLGYLEYRELLYGFDALSDGTPVDSRMRRIYREALEAHERGGQPEPPNPFDSAGAGRFLEWLREPVRPGGGLSRYLFAVYRERPDIQAAFPFVGSLHRDAFRRWAATTGRHQEKIPTELAPEIELPRGARMTSTLTRARVGLESRLYDASLEYPILAKAKPLYFALLRAAGRLHRRTRPESPLVLDVPPLPRRGINLVGYLRAELGIGELGRRLASTLEPAGIPFSTITYSRTVSRQDFPFQGRDAQRAPYDTNVICLNADELPDFAQAAGPEFFSNRYTVGVWFWELDVFPERFHRAFELVDEVWVASEFVCRAVASATTKPVRVVPLPLAGPTAEPIERASLGLPESFLFFFTFDFMSVVERKNPLGLIKAFARAFQPGDGVALLLKSINGELQPANLKQLRRAAQEHPDIYVIDGYLAPETKDGLMASCDCYVSLHRSEGLGLTMAEAMSHAKPVIATGYSGNLAFMREENSYLAPYMLTEVPRGCDPYPAGARWAEPDLDRAAVLMRHVYENPEEAREKGARARNEISTHHSVNQTAAFITLRLAEIWGRRDRERSDEVATSATVSAGDVR